MNRYQPYLDGKPKRGKKTSEQVAADVAAFLTAGKQVTQVPRGVGAWNANLLLRPKERTNGNRA